MALDIPTLPLDELVEDIIDRRGVTPLKLGSDFAASGFRVISAKLIKDGEIDLAADEPRFVDEATYRRWMRTPLQADDVILTSEAPLGEVAYIREPLQWCVGQRLFCIRTRKDRLHGRFLYYALQSEAVRHDLHSRATGTTAQGIRQSELRRVRIPAPPIAEQRAIAEMLGTLDDRIELNRRMTETLEATARAIFKSWFVDFHPVRAKAEGRDPALPRPIADLFSDRFEDSDVGAIPAGWTSRPFSETVGIIGGGTPKTSVAEYWDGEIPWFSVADAPADSEVWVVDTEKRTTQAGVDNSSTRVLAVGTTIISARGTVGRIGLVGVPMAMNQSCYGLRGEVGTEGFFTYYQTRELISVLQRQAHGSVFDTITRNTLAGVSVVVPPPQLVNAFEDRVGPALERIRVALLEARTLAALRDALLPRLISGELRARTADRILEAVPG